MPRPRLTEEEITAMRERVLDAAVSILQDEGAGGLSIRAIAERVGVSHMALYSYFENRDELFSALRDHQRKTIQARHADALARAQTGDIAEVTAEVLQDYVVFARKNPHIFRFLWCTHMDPGGAHPPHQQHDQHSPHGEKPEGPVRGFRKALEHLTDLIELGIERGVYVKRDPTLTARIVFGMIHGPLMLSLVPGTVDNATLELLETEVVKAAMGYLTEQENE